jgi:hypothetical protein
VQTEVNPTPGGARRPDPSRNLIPGKRRPGGGPIWSRSGPIQARGRRSGRSGGGPIWWSGRAEVGASWEAPRCGRQAAVADLIPAAQNEAGQRQARDQRRHRPEQVPAAVRFGAILSRGKRWLRPE